MLHSTPYSPTHTVYLAPSRASSSNANLNMNYAASSPAATTGQGNHPVSIQQSTLLYIFFSFFFLLSFPLFSSSSLFPLSQSFYLGLFSAVLLLSPGLGAHPPKKKAYRAPSSNQISSPQSHHCLSLTLSSSINSCFLSPLVLLYIFPRFSLPLECGFYNGDFAGRPDADPIAARVPELWYFHYAPLAQR